MLSYLLADLVHYPLTYDAAGVRLAEALGRRRTEALAEHGGDTVDVHV